MVFSINRIDHLGIVARTIKDLEFIKLIDKPLNKDHQADATPGEATDREIPFMMNPWSGNTSDNKIFNERIKALTNSIAQSNTGIIHITDSKLYTADNIAQLASRHFYSRFFSALEESIMSPLRIMML